MAIVPLRGVGQANAGRKDAASPSAARGELFCT
jgi:hypothetical protein